MGLDVVVAPIMKKVNNLVRAGVYALRTNRDFPTIAAIPATPVPNPTAAYAYINPLKIDLNGAPAAAFTLSLADGSTGNDKIAVMIYGSVDGSTFSSAWHEKITGSVDPIINDYGAVEKAFELSSGLREIRIYAKQTYVGTNRINITLVPQPKFEAVIPNQSELIKKVVDACFDLSRGQVGANITNWPWDNPDEGTLISTTYAAAAVTDPSYYPSSSGMRFTGDAISISGLLVSVTDTAAISLEVCDKETPATDNDWQQVTGYNAIVDDYMNVVNLNDLVGGVNKLRFDFEKLNAKNWRVKVDWGDATVTAANFDLFYRIKKA